MGEVKAVCISEKKGTVKHDISSCRVIIDHGLEGDAHAGSERQVSLLSYDKVMQFKEQLLKKCEATGTKPVDIIPGVFGENILVAGTDPSLLPVGTKLCVGDVILEITQIGKKCHTGCEISMITGECIMPSEGVFARVLKGGTVRNGDRVNILTGIIAAVITASDRAYEGIREDKSGPLIAKLLEDNGYEVIDKVLLPDEEDALYDALIRLSDEAGCDVIFTTGGTGFNERDRMPEATMRAADRIAPGIAEAIRSYSMNITKKAMFSRAVSVIRKSTLIINLPGSPKAVNECMEYLLPDLEHGIRILKGEADG